MGVRRPAGKGEFPEFFPHVCQKRFGWATAAIGQRNRIGDFTRVE
jgi:hypothetical protein